LKFKEYDYEIVHKAGKGNTNADALSRNPIPDDQYIYISQKDEEKEEEVREYRRSKRRRKTPDFI